MNERTLYIFQTTLSGDCIMSEHVPYYVEMQIISAITERPELINMVFHDRKSGNFYKAVYSI